MARRTGNRINCKEVGNQNRNHETLPDEITLRDEIFELKRQMMALKRTNEQYSVKLRKYEDEAKRKDKQVEQLMDPRKNADVTKVLSTKGAAILMNLKDQNNALIQMILNKDLHIRRLAAEIKMSKLYATTRKNECYRAEINRLRNLLTKSQEALKENVDVQERSICAGGNSILEFSSSSDQSSPRDLDELRATILSLESHVQHSNDLLAKKNQEISSLTNEVNFLKKCFRYKIYKNKAFDWDTTEYKKHRFSTADLAYKWSQASTNQNPLDLFEKNQEYCNLPHSAPATCSKSFSSIDSTLKCSFQSPIIEARKENRTESTEVAVTLKTNQEISETVLGKSHNLAVKEFLKEERTPSNHRRVFCTKEKWVKALNKYRELKKSKRQILTVVEQNESICRKVEIVNATELSNMEAAELEIPKATVQNQESAKEQENLETFNEETSENLISGTPNSMNSGPVNDNETPNTCQNSEGFSDLIRKEDCFDAEHNWSFETEDEKEPKQPTEREKKFSKNSNSLFYTEEEEIFKIKSLREIYRQSVDSSFDSESSSSMKPEVRQVEVEVQINSVSLQNDSDQLGNSISGNNLIFECGRKNGENVAPELNFNDDDDVIVREK